MTFKDLQDDTLDRCSYDSSQTTSGPRTRIKRHLNTWQRRILSMPDFRHLREAHAILTFASVADTATVALPPVVARVSSIRDETNDRTIAERTLAWYRDHVPDPSEHTGTPDFYVPLGLQAAKAVPASTGTGIWVESSAAETPTAYIEGVNTSGYFQSSNVAMTGVTRVQIGSATDWIDLSRCYLSAAATGVVTFYTAATSGTALAVIPIGQTRSEYYGLALVPTPSAAITYTLDYVRRLADMSIDGDEPLLPRDFHWVLGAGARVYEYEKTKDARIVVAQRELHEGLAELRAFAVNGPDHVLVPGGRPVEPNQLGAWYPPNSLI